MQSIRTKPRASRPAKIITHWLATAIVVLWAVPAFTYEVWMGTHLMESSVASNLDDWSLTASMLDGVNINRAPDDTNPASNPEWQTIIAQVNHVGTTMVEIARPEVSRNPNTVDDALIPNLNQELDQRLQGARNFGYVIDYIMIYDERVNGILFEWTQTEIQHLRDLLDAKGRQNIGLIWRSTNNSQRFRTFAALPVIDHNLIEASADALLNNTNNQITFLNWLWSNPATINKKVILQIPRSNNSMTQYASTRRVAVKLGQELGYGQTGVRSDRLVLLPVTYNDNVAYLPETTSSGLAYTNSITGLALSLIEQRRLFEGRDGIPTNADADSFVRQPPPPPDYGTLIAGWDTWNSAVTAAASVTTAGVTGSAVTTSEGSPWHTTDERGASADGDWGTLAGPPSADLSVSDTDNQNLELSNGTSGGTITFTITNNGNRDLQLTGFHFDAYAFRPKAARAYELSVLSGAITHGVIYTSSDDEITSVGGANNNLAHDDISHSLSDLADQILEVGGSARFLLSFSGGEGGDDGAGGHDLWVDNVAISAILTSKLGDFDNDGNVNLADLDQYNGNIGAVAIGGLEALDLDGDGTVGANDFAQHYGTLVETSNGQTGTFAGDLNLDGTVDILNDAAGLVNNLGSSVNSWAQGDFTGDGMVDVLGDAAALVEKLGNTNE